MKKIQMYFAVLLLVMGLSPIGFAQQGVTVSDGASVQKGGVKKLIFPAGGVTISGNVATVGIGSTFANGSSLTDTSSGAFLFGGSVSATPTVQGFSFQGGSGADTAGANTTWKGSIGTGTGVGGNFIWQLAYPSTTSSTPNSEVTFLVFNGANKQASGTAIANASFALTPVVNHSGTAGGDFLLVNATETAKGSGTYNLLDLAVASTSKFTVDDTGVVLTADGTAAAPGQSFLAQNGVGTYRASSNILAFSTAGTGRWEITGSGHLLTVNDNQYTIGSTGANRPASIFLGSPSITVGSGTGITVVNTGEVRTLVHKVTVLASAFSAASKTADVTIATLPAKTRLKGFVLDVTATFSGGGETVASMTCGTSAGDNKILAASDVFTAAARFGLLDADLGTSMVRAAAIQGGFLPSWTGTTAVSCRLTTTTNNTSALTQGTATFYLTTEVAP